MFTGRMMSDYSFPAALDAPPDRNPRRIVNGKDGSDKEVAGYHRQFAAALDAADWGGEVTYAADPGHTPTANPLGPLSRLLAAMLGMFKKG
jgi:hypothetical protein